MLSLFPLLGKRLEDLTAGDLTKIKSVLKIDVELTDELKEAGIALLRGDSIDTVSDLIQKPESIQKLLSFVQQQKPPEVHPHQVIRCPHCELFFIS